MFKLKKNIIILSMLLLIFWGWSSSQVVVMWFFMETNLILFLALMTFEGNMFYSGNSMKFFIVQAFSSLMFFVSVFLLGDFIFWGSFIPSSMMIIKMALFPFHLWVMPMIDMWSWEIVFLYLTIQKMLPFMLLNNLSYSYLWTFSVMAWVGGGVMSLSVKKLKLVFFSSSLFFSGLIIATMILSSKWVVYFLSYTMFSLPLINFNNLFMGGSYLEKIYSQLNWQFKILFWMFILNISGVPPFPGFFLKLDFILMTASKNFYLTLVFLFSSIFMLYMYMYISMNMMLKFKLFNLHPVSSMFTFLSCMIFSMLTIIILILCVGVTRKILNFKTL